MPHTHITDNGLVFPRPTVITTPSGQPFYPHQALACTWGRGPADLRIPLSCGEVIRDTWPNRELARAAMREIETAMRGFEPTAD